MGTQIPFVAFERTHSAIVVSVNDGQVEYVPMSPTGLELKVTSKDTFDHAGWKESAYDPKVAAEKYLKHASLHEINDERALAALRAIISPPESTTQEESKMATAAKKTSAPKKTSAAKTTTKKTSAPKEDKPNADAGDNTQAEAKGAVPEADTKYKGAIATMEKHKEGAAEGKKTKLRVVESKPDAKAKKAEKPAADKKPAAKKAATTTKSSGEGRGRKPQYSDDQVITVKVKENPKHANAKKRFDLYKTGMTVGQYKAAIVKAGLGDEKLGGLDVNWDSGKGWISVK